MGKLFFGDACHSLEIIVAGIAEVRGAKAEENSHRAAVPAFILKEVCAMLGTHLLGKKDCKQMFKIDFYERFLSLGEF